MHGFFRIPLLFLFAGSLLGAFLRWQFISPTPGVNFTFFLHGHSHVMFLGWLFNLFFLAFTTSYVPVAAQRRFRLLFLGMQVLVVGMMISFPLEGYGPVSIALSTLHTVGSFIFILLFFRKSARSHSVASWLARASLLFCAVSAAGPFGLGYLMATGQAATPWYNFSIFWYLHFQYNGFFTFGCLCLFFQLLDDRAIVYDSRLAFRFGRWLAISSVFAYALSVLWATPHSLFYVIGFIAAAGQLASLVWFFPAVRRVLQSFPDDSRWFLRFVVFCLVLKMALQLVSAFPAMARMAYEVRPLLIAYLHVMLVGVITVFVLAWYMITGKLSAGNASRPLSLLLGGFAASEIFLALQPWMGPMPEVIFGSSLLMVLAFALLLARFRTNNPET